MWPFDYFKRQKEEKEEVRAITLEFLQNAIFGGGVSEKEAMEIPSVVACINYIGDRVAMTPVRLFQKKGGKTEEIVTDRRVRLLNNEPSELYTAGLFKKMLAKDYLLYGECYAAMEKRGNQVESLYYLSPWNVTQAHSEKAIGRQVRYWVQGREIAPENLFRSFSISEKGVSGKGLLQTNGELLAAAYNGMLFQKILLQRQGRKNGYLYLDNGKITAEALTELKEKWGKLYNGDGTEKMVLNAGVKFQEISSTPAEMQIVEMQKQTESSIYKALCVPPAILEGTATLEQEEMTFRTAVLPVIKALENACNKYLLLEREKNTLFFSFDTDEATKGKLAERYGAYATAISSGFLQADEAREKENMPPLGLNFIKLGLQDVLYNPKTKEIIVPNMAQTIQTDGGGMPHES